jgi:hypothetical protein
MLEFCEAYYNVQLLTLTLALSAFYLKRLNCLLGGKVSQRKVLPEKIENFRTGDYRSQRKTSNNYHRKNG